MFYRWIVKTQNKNPKKLQRLYLVNKSLKRLLIYGHLAFWHHVVWIFANCFPVVSFDICLCMCWLVFPYVQHNAKSCSGRGHHCLISDFSGNASRTSSLRFYWMIYNKWVLYFVKCFLCILGYHNCSPLDCWILFNNILFKEFLHQYS